MKNNITYGMLRVMSTFGKRELLFFIFVLPQENLGFFFFRSLKHLKWNSKFQKAKAFIKCFDVTIPCVIIIPILQIRKLNFNEFLKNSNMVA